MLTFNGLSGAQTLVPPYGNGCPCLLAMLARTESGDGGLSARRVDNTSGDVGLDVDFTANDFILEINFLQHCQK